MRSLALLCCALALSGCAMFLDPLESSLLYRPRPADPERLASIAKRFERVEEVELRAADGTLLRGWLQKPAGQQRFPVVIVFGGVAREISWMVGWDAKPADWGWLLVNYRGYGLSEGQPAEPVVLADAKALYDYAAARSDIDPERVVLLGRSLGSSIAVSLAAERPARGVILATPFDSLAALGAAQYPYLPTSLLLAGRYDPVALAPEIRQPALFLIAQNDDITPPEHGAALARAWGGEKRVAYLADTTHRRVEYREQYWAEVGAFLARMRASPPSAEAQKRGASAALAPPR